VLLENVKNLYVRFPTYFDSIVRSVEKLGYKVCNKETPVMQCMEHGLPQNRERLILVCIRSDCYTMKFCAPKPLRHVIKLKVRCGD
jgi:site-specific DNA-cytosine methylase